MTAVATDQPVEGRFDGREHRFPVRVYFEDTDLSGVVYHANYLRFMERARSDMLRLVGIDQRATMEAGGSAYAVAELAIKYRRPARLDDALIVVSRLIQVRAAAVAIHQRVMRGSEWLAAADVVAALVGPDGRPRRQPAAWVSAYEALIWQPEATGANTGDETD
ncbi:MAG: tol-pal system-associated acyl-CoA thioesterase [Sphingomonas sp.]|uniref:tol-pal system-associated acyl-CoA thioesterase n=1 Tax=Sphingomonas sp. TaxID=28214 RepID=UPI001AC51619|nr:tol-pal system-associated acyl-CoA thioesterase [Sphingomonas sp.]MBN8806739.1 tol-pal system-associated acyl-CoA thioesterase [Sphingomonas sp.]